MRKLILSILLVLAGSPAYADLTPFSPLGDVHAEGVVQLVISSPPASTTPFILNSANGLSCTSDSNSTRCDIVPSSQTCTLPNGTIAPCLQVGEFDIFKIVTLENPGQIAILTNASPSGSSTTVNQIKLQNTKIVRRDRGLTPDRIKFELSTTIGGVDVSTTARAHGTALSGIFYRSVKNSDGTSVSATASAVTGTALIADAAQVQGSFVYLKDGSNCISDPVSTTCQGGRTIYRDDLYTVLSGSLSNNTIKFAGPIFLQDNLIPSAVTCTNAFSNGTNCQNVEHLRMTSIFTLAKPSSITSLNPLAGCSKPPCTTFDFVNIQSTGTGNSGATEDVLLEGINLLIQTPTSSLNPGDQGTFTLGVLGTEAVDTSSCNCFDIFDSQSNLIVPGATLFPGGAKATQCLYDKNIDNKPPKDAFFKFNNEDITGVLCSDAPRITMVLTAVCKVHVTGDQTTTAKNNKITTTHINEFVTTLVEGQTQAPITPCH